MDRHSSDFQPQTRIGKHMHTIGYGGAVSLSTAFERLVDAEAESKSCCAKNRDQSMHHKDLVEGSFQARKEAPQASHRDDLHREVPTDTTIH